MRLRTLRITDQLVELAARALWAEFRRDVGTYQDDAGIWGEVPAWDKASADDRAVTRRQALAVLEAVRTFHQPRHRKGGSA